MDHSDNQQKPQINYPCMWEYTLIGKNENDIRDAVRSVLNERAHTVLPSNKSTQGRYISFCVSLPVESEEDRNDIFNHIKDHPAISMVL